MTMEKFFLSHSSVKNFEHKKITCLLRFDNRLWYDSWDGKHLLLGFKRTLSLVLWSLEDFIINNLSEVAYVTHDTNVNSA